jgi:phage terminase small subunit
LRPEQLDCHSQGVRKSFAKPPQGRRPAPKPFVKSLDERLNPRQRQFVAEYLVDRNATQAAIRAGYSPNGAGQAAHKLLKNAEILKAVTEGLEALLVQPQGEAERLLREIEKIAYSEIGRLFDDEGRLLSPHELPPEVAPAVRSMRIIERRVGKEVVWVKRIQLWDKLAALGLLLKYYKLLTDKVEHNGKIESAVTHDFSQMSDGELRVLARERYNQLGALLGESPSK